jgi:hypothetical protein
MGACDEEEVKKGFPPEQNIEASGTVILHKA